MHVTLCLHLVIGTRGRGDERSPLSGLTTVYEVVCAQENKGGQAAMWTANQ